jgi:hypothetical protein
LILELRPEFSGRTCEDCQKWLFNDETGQVVTDRSGRQVKRSKAFPTLCRRPGRTCPKGSPENQKGFTPAAYRVYRFIKICQATGRFPADSLVEDYAETVRLAEDAARRQIRESDNGDLQRLVLRMGHRSPPQA